MTCPTGRISGGHVKIVHHIAKIVHPSQNGHFCIFNAQWLISTAPMAPVNTESFSSFIGQLQRNLKKPLPGEIAHQRMEVSSATWLQAKPTAQTRKSAVLILLYPVKNEIYFPLILRASYNGFHSGEIGFPGGRVEPTDEDLIHTALREAREEIGLRPEDVTIVGTLTEIFIAPSNFLVLPVVGYMSARPDFLPDAREVAAILETPLDHFSNPDIVGCSEIQIPGEWVSTPYYDMKGYKIWGATAKMIRELLAIVTHS